MTTILHDIKNSSVGGVSLAPGTTINGSSEILGDAVDMGDGSGNINGIFLTGAATGSPTTVALTLKLHECDTSGGSYTEISGASLALTAHATANNKQLKYIVSGLRTKRYVKAGVTPTFSGGSSPTMPTAACVIGQARKV